MRINWYSRVVTNLAELPNAIQYYEDEYEEARKELIIRGNIERMSADMPGQIEHRFSQIQEIEAILEYLNIELKAIRSKYHRAYLENYQRVLSSKDIDRYIDGEVEVINQYKLINEFALVRNKWLSISKGFDTKSYRLGDITRLRAAGLEDATII
jgi:hypothetical protein